MSQPRLTIVPLNLDEANERLLTYTLPAESGASLRAAGWRVIGETPGRSWSVPSRPRVDKHPLGQKLVWEAV